MSEASPFDQYEDAPADDREEKEEADAEEEEDDPFSHVPQAHSSGGQVSLDQQHPPTDEETPLRSTE